jgi:hypothetical protein
MDYPKESGKTLSSSAKYMFSLSENLSANKVLRNHVLFTVHIQYTKNKGFRDIEFNVLNKQGLHIWFNLFSPKFV